MLLSGRLPEMPACSLLADIEVRPDQALEMTVFEQEKVFVFVYAGSSSELKSK